MATTQSRNESVPLILRRDVSPSCLEDTPDCLGAHPKLTCAAHSHLSEWVAFRVLRQRHHLSGDGSVCAEGNRATGDQASSLSPSRGNGVKHRKHGDDHRQPAKHPDWIFLRYRLPGFSLALGSGCSGGSLPRLARVVVALLSSANP